MEIQSSIANDIIIYEDEYLVAINKVATNWCIEAAVGRALCLTRDGGVYVTDRPTSGYCSS